MSRIARKNDNQDRRRILDLQREFQTKNLREYDATPDAKQVRNEGFFIINEDGKTFLAIRQGSTIKKVEVS